MATHPPTSLRATISELAEALPSLPLTASLAAVADLCLSDEGNDWLVLVDNEARPVRLIERAALLEGKPFEHRPVAVDDETSVEAAVSQALASESRAARPIVSCDASGRYLGLVRVERMLALLGRA